VDQGVKVQAFADYSQDLTLEILLQQSGIPLTVRPYTVDTLLEGQSSLEVGNWKFSIEHIPGHSPDSIAFITDGYAFAGDTLFACGIGRADLPGGDMELLIRGIRNKLLTLDQATQVFPGHGPVTNIKTERNQNPYLS
jgi:glyoxylase-like metal-dependent hydrolase (beta-lactamase superfamily II)